jgi:hypothetical protein
MPFFSQKLRLSFLKSVGIERGKDFEEEFEGEPAPLVL